MDSHRRSIIKSITYRLLAIGATVIITYLFTKEIKVAIGVGIADTVVKIALYYGHERLWTRR